jgi:hypothetical protein
MKWTTTAGVISYEYAGDGDSKGRIAKRESVPEKTAEGAK